MSRRSGMTTEGFMKNGKLVIKQWKKTPIKIEKMETTVIDLKRKSKDILEESSKMTKHNEVEVIAVLAPKVAVKNEGIVAKSSPCDSTLKSGDKPPVQNEIIQRDGKEYVIGDS